jgi:hypothetical protein|tara:strand:- start:2748 stop:3224 length:477 start_codon:yes stop_codon:yes gene_type:complete
MISLQDIELAQKKWGENVIQIGSLKNDLKASEKATDKMLKDLYAFDLGHVLFKPTKATKIQFRLNFEGAKSYFIGRNPNYDEDAGFAFQPWIQVKFENKSVILNEKSALAMGNYFFTDPNGLKVKVEYTFSYIRCAKGKIKINLHHSSFPFNDEAYFN